MTDEDRYWKTDHDGWELDTETGAIINRDKNAYERWRLRVMEDRRKKELEKEVRDLRSDVNDIKTLLKEIHRKING